MYSLASIRQREESSTPKCDQAIERAQSEKRAKALLTDEAKHRIAYDIGSRSKLLETAFREGRWQDAADQAMALCGHIGIIRHLAENLMETERRLFS